LKQKLSLALIACIAGCMLLQAQPVKIHGKLRVDGIQLKDEHGNAVVLRGMSYGWHNWWPQFYNAGTVKWLYTDWHCSVLRAAMGVEPSGGYIDKPDWSKQTIRTVVDAAIKEGIYVIIDWHSHNIRLDEARKFFTEMATAYHSYPNIIYEIFNEPERQSWTDVKAYSTEIVSTIRKIDPDNIILVGNPHWDQDINLVADDPLQGFTNIMYTVHFYAATHKQELRDRCEYALKKGIPIFISESAGMEATGNGPLNYNEWYKWIDWCEKNKISWVTWSVADKDETCSVLVKGSNPTGNWQLSDLKESGVKAREILRKYAASK
jgi:endoglucanase